ncbi:MAG: hypothetical protein KGZ73_09760 [Rhizobiales bacterium]|nr:hypothetical protein [Hyphomicrobiales bacterium]
MEVLTVNYLDCWDVSANDFPTGCDKLEQIKFLLRYAILAPSNHNTQPWLFEVRGGEVAIIADRTRTLPVSDPDDRELFISCGAALFFLETAARAFGFDVSIRRFPQQHDPDLVAVVEIGKRSTKRSGRPELFEAITSRRTNRSKFSDNQLSPASESAIEAATSANGVRATWINSRNDRVTLAHLIGLADRAQFEDRAFRKELSSWVNPDRASEPDGLPAKSIGFDSPWNYVAPLLIRTFDLGPGKSRIDEALIQSSAAIMVLSTGFDKPIDWVRTGDALAAALLTAESQGVNASYLNQVCEVEDTRFRLAKIGTVQGYPQLVLRLGYGIPVAPTPRRPLDSVIRIRADAA